jgi:hypothetical protein
MDKKKSINRFDDLGLSADSVLQCNDTVNGVHFSTRRIGAVVHFNIDRFPNFLCQPETDTYFIDRRWKQGNSEGDRSQVECE